VRETRHIKAPPYLNADKFGVKIYNNAKKNVANPVSLSRFHLYFIYTTFHIYYSAGLRRSRLEKEKTCSDCTRTKKEPCFARNIKKVDGQVNSCSSLVSSVKISFALLFFLSWFESSWGATRDVFAAICMQGNKICIEKCSKGDFLQKRQSFAPRRLEKV